MEDYITRHEYEEHKNAMNICHKAMDDRLDKLEKTTVQINSLAISVNKLAQSIEMMVKEQSDHSKRLDILEERDGEMWRKVIGYICTAVIGIIVGFIFNQIGM